jgi:hypothetical protein
MQRAGNRCVPCQAGDAKGWQPLRKSSGLVSGYNHLGCFEFLNFWR